MIISANQEIERMANVILVNRTRRPSRMLIYNLAKNIAAVKVENRTMEETRDGKRAKRVSSKLVPDSIRIPAKGELEVDEKILFCPEVKAGIGKRDLRVKKPEVSLRAASSEGENGPKPRTKKRG